jgi:prophage maintenance system killer protein
LISDFTETAAKPGLKVEELHEFFDGNDRTKISRILA